METFSRDNDYWETYTRNFSIISRNQQEGIKKMKIAVGGCGSTGGAFIDGLLRLGVTKYHLTDNGLYDQSNLNRQMVSRKDIGKNKAIVYGERIADINPDALVNTWSEGLTEANMGEFLDDVDFLFDGVDVTTSDGMKAKLALHEMAAERKIPTGSALDLGFTQWIQSYNYHTGDAVLHGRLDKAKKATNPISSVLEGFINLEEIPDGFMNELLRFLKEPTTGVSQVSSACFLLSSLTAPYLLYFIEHKKLPPLVVIDIKSFFETKEQQEEIKGQAAKSLPLVRQILAKL
tara:strand:- start:69170 stop:70039 length:870 start_codon:yes stop_codon:yes gene_type:complete